MSDVSVQVPQSIADELERRAQLEGKSLADVLREALALPDQDPFEFVGSFESEEVNASDVDERLAKLGFGEE